ncbi:MAG: YdgA family protein [Firmicutes bacterium]|nr:YdgA family protein [Bacillota bacterium]
MARSIKWLVGLAVIVGITYVALVAITGSKMRDIASQQLEAYQQQNPEVDVDLTWHDTSFWRSEGVVSFSMDIEDEQVAFTHTMNLRHGALRASVTGEITGIVGEFDVNQRLFEGQAITLDGRVGLGGLSLTYHVPEVNFDDQNIGLQYRVAAFDVDVVLRDSDQHSQLTIDWIEMLLGAPDTGVDANQKLRFENVQMRSHTDVGDDGLFDASTARFSIDHIYYTDAAEPVVSMRDFSSDIDMQRNGDYVAGTANLMVNEYDAYGVTGVFELETSTSELSFSAFRTWQENSNDPDAINDFLVNLQQQQSALNIDNLRLTMGQMGNLVANGSFTLREDLDFSTGFDPEADDNIFQGNLIVEDLPVLLLMPLSGLVSGELPWVVELREGNMLVNGEPLDLPQ